MNNIIDFEKFKKETEDKDDKDWFNIFIGYDRREDLAYKVCEYSIRKNNKNCMIQPLVQDQLRAVGLYTRSKDEYASTDFSLTRFMVPLLASPFVNNVGHVSDWALFVDCDFLFTNDPYKLIKKMDPKYAVYVVKHDYTPKEAVKMDGCPQYIYPRKNWSSFIFWNVAHPSNQVLMDPKFINESDPSTLHQFKWLKDDEIGELDISWNYLVDVYPTIDIENINALHYTLGAPFMENYVDCSYSNEWLAELAEMQAEER